MKKILLIIDDEDIVYKALSSQFSQEEVEIISVKDGVQGLEAAINHHPDLILLDLVMPKMDGITMLSKLRQDDWGKTAKVIVLSNIGDTDKVKEAADHNVYEYLIKANLDVFEVVKKIKEVIGI